MTSYERELEKLVANEFEKPSSLAKPEGAKASALPPWLQNAKVQDEDSMKKQETTEVNSAVIHGLLVGNHYWQSASVK